VTAVRLRSHAKVNLDLRVGGRRADGYHELRTVFQTISLADTIEIDYRQGRTKVELASDPEIPGNLILKAADLVLEATGATGRFTIRLRKRIPLGGGLGGGSSNAAAILLALPVLTRKRLPLEQAMELAARLGSDVPFFLLGGTAAALGRGAELYPLPEGPAWPLAVVTPGVPISTPAAFQALNRELTNGVPSPIINSFQAFVWRLGSFSPGEDWGCVNDFESVVFPQYPQLESIKGKLLELGARPSLMSGSGSTVFGVFRGRELRDRAAAALRKTFGTDKVHAVSTLSGRGYRALWRRQLGDDVDPGIWPPQSRYAR
jgi:4-diphosphocytidyl-2-C-methyl-D-erythritol kinase